MRPTAGLLTLAAHLALAAPGAAQDPVDLTPSGVVLEDGARFGASVTGLGLVTFQNETRAAVAIGAPESAAGSGSVFFRQFDGSGGVLVMSEPPHAVGPPGARLGSAVVGIGNWDGAPGLDLSNEGAFTQPGTPDVLLYSMPLSGPVSEALPSSFVPCSACEFGAALAGNPDAIDNAAAPRQRRLFVIGSPGSSSGLGRIDVFWQEIPGETSPGTLRHRRIDGDQVGERFGAALALSDINGDGDLDIIAGSPGFKGPGDSTARGRVRVLRAPDYLSFAPGWSPEGDGAGDEFGAAVASVGDVDNDGVGDIGVGSPGARSGGTGSGRVTVLSGVGGAKLYTLQGRTWSVGGQDVGERFGASLASLAAGGPPANIDFNNDERPDFAVGAPLASPGGRLNAGAVYVYAGEQGSAPGKLLLRFDGANADDGFGTAIAGVGDLNGDGFHDLLVGAPNALSAGGIRRGAARVFFGAATPVPALGTWGLVILSILLGWAGLSRAAKLRRSGSSEVE